MTTGMQQQAKKRLRDERSDDGPAAQQVLDIGYPCSLTIPPVPAQAPSPDSEQCAHSPCNQLPDPASEPNGSHTPVPVCASLLQTGEESDDVEEQFMRALEEELEAPGAIPAITATAVFQDVDEDDESEDDTACYTAERTVLGKQN